MAVCSSSATDDSDDDWENDDALDEKLKLPQEAKKEEVWSDEEGHDAHKKPDPVAEAAKQAPKPAPPKPKSQLELKIEAREQKEREEAERKEALLKQLHGDDAIDVADGEMAEKLRRQQLEETLKRPELEASEPPEAFPVSGMAPLKDPTAPLKAIARWKGEAVESSATAIILRGADTPYFLRVEVM